VPTSCEKRCFANGEKMAKKANGFELKPELAKAIPDRGASSSSSKAE
jgi:hypothetical protein